MVIEMFPIINFAVYSDLGLFPMIIPAITSGINFWIHPVHSSSVVIP